MVDLWSGRAFVQHWIYRGLHSDSPPSPLPTAPYIFDPAVKYLWKGRLNHRILLDLINSIDFDVCSFDDGEAGYSSIWTGFYLDRNVLNAGEL